jgi:hypothetical protein
MDTFKIFHFFLLSFAAWYSRLVVEGYHWTGLKKATNRCRFLIFFHFSVWYLKRLQSCEPLHTKMNPNSCLFGSQFAWAQTTIFPPKLQKCGIVNCSLDYCSWVEHWGVPTSRNPNQNSTALWRIFSSNKSVPANSMQWFYTNRIRTSRKLDSFLYEGAQNFEVFTNIQN